jgi:hypothetical protein
MTEKRPIGLSIVFQAGECLLGFGVSIFDYEFEDEDENRKHRGEHRVA